MAEIYNTGTFEEEKDGGVPGKLLFFGKKLDLIWRKEVERTLFDIVTSVHF